MLGTDSKLGHDTPHVIVHGVLARVEDPTHRPRAFAFAGPLQNFELSRTELWRSPSASRDPRRRGSTCAGCARAVTWAYAACSDGTDAEAFGDPFASPAVLWTAVLAAGMRRVGSCRQDARQPGNSCQPGRHHGGREPGKFRARSQPAGKRSRRRSSKRSADHAPFGVSDMEVARCVVSGSRSVPRPGSRPQRDQSIGSAGSREPSLQSCGH